jgi:hypothetical protein
LLSVAFFDVLGFFGATSFLAWITFAPLQSDQLEKFTEWSSRKTARDNFAEVNDYFLGSFLGFASAAGCDYIYHYVQLHQVYKAYATPLFDGIGVGFFTGMAGLLWAILYVRLIIKGEKDWDDLNLPPLSYTVVISAFVVVSAYLEATGLVYSPTFLEGGAWFVSILFTVWAGWQTIRYHDEVKLKRGVKHRAIIGSIVLLSIFVIANYIVIPFIRWVESENLTDSFILLLGILTLVYLAYHLVPVNSAFFELQQLPQQD